MSGFVFLQFLNVGEFVDGIVCRQRVLQHLVEQCLCLLQPSLVNQDESLSPIEEWGDDLFVYFQYRIDETKLAQGKYNDETERKVRDFIGKDRKFAELFSKPNNGSKTLFRQELNKYTSHIRTGVNEKYVHKNLQAHLMKELDEFIKKRLLDLDFILGKVKGK